MNTAHQRFLRGTIIAGLKASAARNIQNSITSIVICSRYDIVRTIGSNNNNNNTRTIFMALSSILKHCESSPWFTRWMQHGARWQPTFGPSRSAWTIIPPAGCQLTTLTIAILLLLSPKADTHFTIPRRVEGWVDLVGWLHTEMVYPLARGHPSKY